MRRSVALSITAFLAAMSFAVSGCTGSSGGGGGIDEPSASSNGDRPTITFAAAMFAESGRGPKLEALVQEFNDSQDKVTVKPASIPFSSFGTTIFTQMGGGAGPDIIRFDHTDFYAAADAELLLPLDDSIKDSDYEFLKPDEHSKVAGKRYAVPFEISNYSLIYNPELLTGDVPTNYEELLSTAKDLTKDGVYGFAYRTTMPEQAGFWFDLSNFVYGVGGKWSDDSGKPTINSPEVIAGVTRYKEVYDAKVTPEGADAATYRRMFAEGKIAMMIDNGGVPPILQGQNPNVPIKAVSVPFESGAAGQVITPLAVNANTKNPAEATSFIKWLLEPAQQVKLQGVLGASSAATTTTRTDEQLKSLPFAPVYDEATDTGIPFVVKGNEVATPEIRQTVVDAVVRILQGQGDVKTVLDETQAKVESMVS
jgi:multiple sugar transport system substrate-binding protein